MMTQPPTMPLQSDAPRRFPDRRRVDPNALQWASKLVSRYAVAASREQRNAILLELDLPYILDEDAALALYRLDAEVSGPFIQRHLPAGRRAEDERLPWHRLMGHALSRADSALYFALYRRQAPTEQWLRETEQLCRDLTNPYTLCPELEQRHPQRWRAQTGPHLFALAQVHGEAMLPYLVRHGAEIWAGGRRIGYQQIVELAYARGWWELWAALLRGGASAPEYDAAVSALASDGATSDADLMHRLLLLAGVGLAPGNRARRDKPLREDTILGLYERFPHLVRGPYRNQLDPSSRRPLTGVLELAIRQRDDEVIERLAARLAVRADRSGADELLQAAAHTARFLETVADDDAAEHAATAILKRIPAKAIRNSRELLRRNPLARLLFARAHQACMHHAQDAADLLQAAERHVCAFAASALASDAPQAQAQARANLDILLMALDRGLPRSIIRRVLRGLERIPDTPVQAAQIVDWARDKLAADEPRFPKEGLLSLIAHQLSRFPVLCFVEERAVIYRRRAA